jgi:hypothetical protein
MLIGLEVGEHTSARMAASAHLPVRAPIVAPRQAASQRSAMDNTGRLVKRARRAGLEVQPAEGAPVGSTPGVRKCGICRQPGHRMQTCPVASEQKKDSFTALIPSTDTFEDGAALFPPHDTEGYEGSGSNILVGTGHSDGEALSSLLTSRSSFTVGHDARDYASEYQQERDAAAILFGADGMGKRFKAAAPAGSSAESTV